jgi:hypothetical protein
MNTKPKLEGWAAIKKNYPDWVSHKVPLWMRGKLRERFKQGGRPYAFDDSEIDFFPECHGLFDHWGRVGKGNKARLVTMPYGSHHKQAEAFAKLAGATLTIHEDDGCWASGTVCYEFSKPEPFHFY